MDIAREAAKQAKLPPVERAEDIENYSTQNTIDLAYHIGLLARPEWRRLSRCYEIRRDLEHEDDEYEAGPEDVIYIFKTCVECVLAKDPVHLPRVQDIKSEIEKPAPSVLSEVLIEDFRSAPQPRQEEILRFLVSVALDKKQVEVVQQNAYKALTAFEPFIQNPVKLQLASHFQERVGRSGLDRRHARVAYGAGVLPYLKHGDRVHCFEDVYTEMKRVGSAWRSHPDHGELLRSYRELGGLAATPPSVRLKILKWLVITYLGESGGMTTYGTVRHVFYSNTAAPPVTELIRDARDIIGPELQDLESDKVVASRCGNPHIARALPKLAGLGEPGVATVALVAEELVAERLNCQGFFTIRGVRCGVHEMDFLAIKPLPSGTFERRQIEVQCAPTGESATSPPVPKGVRKDTGCASDSARKREVSEVRQGVKEWVA